jgi:hypothetical protein
MKKLIFLITTTIFFSVAGNAKTTDKPQRDKNDPVEITINEEDLVLYSHEKSLDLGCTLPLIPPVVMEWEVGGPVFFIEYKIRFKPTEEGTKMIITCDLVKKQ